MPLRVAIFDDNKKIRDALSMLIKGSEGFEWAGGFSNCNNLLKDIEKADPDVILMDIEMPGMSGINAVKEIHKHKPDIKVLMQTVYEDNEKIFYSICYGASGYILKSTPPSKLLEYLTEADEGGAPMSPAVAKKVLQLFQTNPPATTVADEAYNLSYREKEVLELLVKGKSLKMIAAELFITYSTVRSHIQHIYEKLHVASLTEAVSKALNERLF